MAIRAVLRSVYAHLLGLDSADNLVIGGKLIYYGNRADGVIPEGVIDLSAIGGAASLNSVSAVLGAGPLNNLGAPASGDALQTAGYVGGASNRLILTPAAGGSTINGLDPTGVPDNWVIPILNGSLADALIFAHLAGGSLAADSFSNQGAGNYTIEAGAGATLRRVGALWRFT